MHALSSCLSMVALAVTVCTSQRAAASDSATTTAITVYRCRTEAQTILADRPCGENAERIEITTDAGNAYTAAPPKSPPGRPPVARPPANGGSALQLERQQERCRRLGSEIERVRSQLRAGYRVRQGEKLRERLRRAKRELRDAHCR